MARMYSTTARLRESYTTLPALLKNSAQTCIGGTSLSIAGMAAASYTYQTHNIPLIGQFRLMHLGPWVAGPSFQPNGSSIADQMNGLQQASWQKSQCQSSEVALSGGTVWPGKQWNFSEVTRAWQLLLIKAPQRTLWSCTSFVAYGFSQQYLTLM